MSRDDRPPPDYGRDDAHLAETRIDGEQVYRGALLDVRRDRVRLPDASEAVREFVVHPGAVLMVPVLDNGHLVVERQFRYPPNRVFIEFPAGKLDPGESSLATAQRELIEETGYRADEFVPLGRVHSLVSYSTEVIDFFEARGLSQVGAALDHGEFLEVIEMTPQAMLAALDRGEITDAKTVAALLMFVRRHAP